MKVSIQYKGLVDLLDRAGSTFAQAFLASVTVAGSTSDFSALKVAGVAGAYAVAKFVIVKANSYLSKQGSTPPAA